MTPDALAAVDPDRRVRSGGGRGSPTASTRTEAARRVRDRLPDAISVYSFPSLPPDVANLDGVQFLPRVLGLFLGLLAIAAVGHALASSVRRRRHDLGSRAGRSASWPETCCGRSRRSPGRSWPSAWPSASRSGSRWDEWPGSVVADEIGVRAAASTSPLTLLVVALVACLAAAALSRAARAWRRPRQRSVDALRAE